MARYLVTLGVNASSDCEPQDIWDRFLLTFIDYWYVWHLITGNDSRAAFY